MKISILLNNHGTFNCFTNKALGEKAPTYRDIKDLRLAASETEQKKVVTFYKKVMPCVAGKKKFKKIMHHKTISEAVTVSLEALALWIIFNYEEKWSTEGTTRESPAKFTGVTKGNKIYSGCDAAGIIKYNEFREFVKFNRQEDDGVFEDAFKLEMTQEHEDRILKKHNSTLPEDDVVCENDLDSKLSDISKVVYTRETRKNYDVPSSHDSTSMSSQSSVSASSYHSAPHYNTDNSGTYQETL